jgi:hypothetical protein
MTNLHTLNRRLDRLDGGDPLNCEHMSDGQLDRLITHGMTPTQREKYRTGTAEEIDAMLQAIIAKGKDTCTR